MKDDVLQLHRAEGVEVFSYLELMKKLLKIRPDTPETEKSKLERLIYEHLNKLLGGRDENAMELGELVDAVKVLDRVAELIGLNTNTATKYWNALSKKLDDAVAAGRARREYERRNFQDSTEHTAAEAEIRELKSKGYEIIKIPNRTEVVIINPNTPEAEALEKSTLKFF